MAHPQVKNVVHVLARTRSIPSTYRDVKPFSVSVRIPGANLTHLELFVLSLESVTPPKGTNLVPTFPIGLNCIHTSFFSSTCNSFINHKPKDNQERKTRAKTRTFHGNCIRFYTLHVLDDLYVYNLPRKKLPNACIRKTKKLQVKEAEGRSGLFEI